MRIAAIILAAGSSSRMSKPKQLLYYKGKSMINNLAQQISTLETDTTICITGYLKNEIEEELKDYNFKFLHNSNYNQGMSSSLKTAVSHIIDSEIDALLVTLSDQPLIPTTHYQNIIHASNDNSIEIVTTSFNKTYGAPTLFKKSLFQDLLKLNAQQGAKSIIKKHREKAIFLDCGEAMYDVDTDEDYMKLTKRAK